MLVYVVMMHVDYECDWPDAVFSSEEKAEEYLKSVDFVLNDGQWIFKGDKYMSPYRSVDTASISVFEVDE